jgi:hypothetical protein
MRKFIPESLMEEGDDGLPRTPRLASFMQSNVESSLEDAFGVSKGNVKDK